MTLIRFGVIGSAALAHSGGDCRTQAHLGSERARRRRLEQRSGLGELLEVDFEAMGENAPYRAADALIRTNVI